MKQLSSDVFLSSTAGLQATTKHSGFPVRMENAVPIVPQAPAAQPLQIQSGVLTQVKTQKNPNQTIKQTNEPHRAKWNSCHPPGESEPDPSGVNARGSQKALKGSMQITSKTVFSCFIFLEYFKFKLDYAMCLPGFRSFQLLRMGCFPMGAHCPVGSAVCSCLHFTKTWQKKSFL